MYLVFIYNFQNEGNTRKPGVLKSWQLIMYGTSSSQVTASGENTNIRMKENQNLKTSTIRFGNYKKLKSPTVKVSSDKTFGYPYRD